MKKIILSFILIPLIACNSSYNHRPVQDQVVGGTSLLDAFTGRDRVGLIAKQAHYDSFISKPIPSQFSNIPILNIFSKPAGYEICRAPPADAMASTASSLVSALSVEGSGGGTPITAKIAGSLVESFANKVKAFSIRTQGLQYIRDVRFDNCIIWQNRGNLSPAEEKVLRTLLIKSNENADKLGIQLISEELKLRAVTNNFGVSAAEVSKKEFDEMVEKMKTNIEKVESKLEKTKEINSIEPAT